MKKELTKRIRQAARKLSMADRRFTERQYFQTLKRQIRSGDMMALSAVLENS